MINYGNHVISSDDLDAVRDSLENEPLSGGPSISVFEDSIGARLGEDVDVVVVANATLALLAAYRALGVTANSIVWCPTITFAATANAALFLGAKVKFLDIDESSFNLDVDRLEEVLANTSKNELPDVLTAVHMCGSPCDLSKLKQLSSLYGFKLLEDASHALGATYLDSKIGDCTYSDICIFSFHPVKMITTGEGGALTTRDHRIAEKLRLLTNQGIKREAPSCGFEDTDFWQYTVTSVGLNMRIPSFNAALGLSQLRKLDEFLMVRSQLVDVYKSRLNPEIVEFQSVLANSKSSNHLLVVRLNQPVRNLLLKRLGESGIKTTIHYSPLHLHPLFRDKANRRGAFPAAEKYFMAAITLPLYVGLDHGVVELVCDIVNESRDWG